MNKLFSPTPHSYPTKIGLPGFVEVYLTLVLFGFGLITFIPSFIPINPSYITIGFRAVVLVLSLVLLAAWLLSMNKKLHSYVLMVTLFLTGYTFRLIGDVGVYDFGMTKDLLYLKLLILVLLPFITLSFVRVKGRIEVLAFYILASVISLSFVALITGSAGYRLSGNETLNPITLGYYAGYMLITIYYLLISGNRSAPFKFTLYIFAVLSVIILIASLSRGALFGVFLFCLLEMLIRKNIVSIKVIFLFLIFLLILYFAQNLFSGLALNRISLDLGSSGGEGEARVFLWALAAQNILSNPVFGSHVTTEFGYVHNVYLEAFMATGLVGLTLLLVPIGVCIQRFISFRKRGITPPITYFYFIFAVVTATFSGTVYSSSFLFCLLPVVLTSRNPN
jgi:O-antigen ligase|tara:strand:- start:296 stop:1474 length:1179 start_codon:yes stop_codon:yes gene_type:complete